MSALTRRRLLQAAGAGTAGALVGPGIGGAQDSPETSGEPPPSARRNVVVIVASSLRRDFVEGFDDSSGLAKTPNLKALVGESLRFERAVAESMSWVPARRALLTGMRSYPFRDWVATDGFPSTPGWNRIFENRQPIVTDVMRRAGVTTAYATDNPFLIGPNFANFRATLDEFRPRYTQGGWSSFNRGATSRASSADARRRLPDALRGTAAEGGLRDHLGARVTDSARRVADDGITLLRTLSDRQPFFLGVDFFDPSEPWDAPGTPDDATILPFAQPSARVEALGLSDSEVGDIRALYAAEVTFVDQQIGRVVDAIGAQGLGDNTLLVVVSDGGVLLGEAGVIGRDPARIREELFRVPMLIRDPGGRRSGDDTEYFALTQDVPTTALAWLGVSAPGKMMGEDLLALLDDESPPRRPYYTVGFEDSIVVGDENWLLTATGGGDFAQKKLFQIDKIDGDEIPGEEDAEDYREDPDRDVINERAALSERMWQVALITAGGTIPRFGADRVIRPQPEGKEPDVLNGDDELSEEEKDDLNNGFAFVGGTNWVLRCACGAALVAATRHVARRDAWQHFRTHHPDDLEGKTFDDLIAEEPAEAEAAPAAPLVESDPDPDPEPAPA